jgi:hypothetical protein
MWWMPLAWLGWKAVRALVEWEQKQAAKYRCHICRNDSHTTEEHRRPKLSVSRRADLVKCQIAVPFVLAAFIAGILFINHDLNHWIGGAVAGVIGWPLWAATVRHRFRKDQRKENGW